MKIYKKNGPFNILMTLDENYLFFLNAMLMSLLHYNPKRFFRIYLLQTSIKDDQLEETRQVLKNQGELFSIRMDDAGLEDASTTERYPKEIYYRIFAAWYLPDSLDRLIRHLKY